MAERKVIAANAQHSHGSMEWGTPRKVVELAKRVLGTIDIDPATSAYWVHYSPTGAKVWYDEHSDGLKHPWRGNVFLNPPGTVARRKQDDRMPVTIEPNRPAFEKRSMPRRFWEKLFEHWRSGEVDSAIWVGFSLEQLQQLQGSPSHPMQFLSLVPCERLPFLEKPEGGGPPYESTSPTHGNFITLLHSRRPDRRRQQFDLFLEAGSRLDMVSGALTLPAVAALEMMRPRRKKNRTTTTEA